MVPTAAQRNGDFSALPLSAISQQYRPNLIDPDTGQAFPGNIIPQSRLDPVAQRVLEYLPTASAADGLIFYQRANKETDNQYLARVDHQFSSKHQLSGRYFFDTLKIPSIIDPQNILTAVANRRWLSQSAVANYTVTVSPTVLVNTSLSYNRASAVQTQPEGFPGHRELGINVPTMSTGSTFQMNVNQYFSNSFNALYRVPRNQYNLQHGWTVIKGRHELEFGLDIVREQSILD